MAETEEPYTILIDNTGGAIVAIAIFILVLTTAAIIFVIITYSRYRKFVKQYRVYQDTYDMPTYVEPPSFLREYETQSVNVYVPPDEAVDIDGVNITFEGTYQPITPSGEPGVAAAINPLYHGEHKQGEVNRAFNESTTML